MRAIFVVLCAANAAMFLWNTKRGGEYLFRNRYGRAALSFFTAIFCLCGFAMALHGFLDTQ